MAYFAPYLDETGLHLPTYEDRLEALVSAYRDIFGVEAELSAAVPDYQLLSVLARALDDASALTLQAYNALNPAYASGAALDLLLPQYGLTRLPGETDAAARSRIRLALAGGGSGSADAILAAVRSVDNVRDAKLYVNDTDAADALGLPAHTLGLVVRGGTAAKVAQALFDKKAPGIGTWGASSGTATDADGATHTLRFTRVTNTPVYIHYFVRLLSGSMDAVAAAVRPAALAFVNGRGIAAGLNVPQLYGVAYSADPALAQTFIVTDIQVTTDGGGPWRDFVPCAWNGNLEADAATGVTFHVSDA